MSPYYFVERSYDTGRRARLLLPEKRFLGIVRGKSVNVKILSGDTLSVNGVIERSGEGAITFDRPLHSKPQTYVVHLDNNESRRLRGLHNKLPRLQYQQVLAGVERRAEVQSGARKRGTRNIFERLHSLTSEGRTEFFSKDY